MAGSEFNEIEQLNDYWDAVVRDMDAELQTSDPATVATVQGLRALDDTPAPDPAFSRQLWLQLMMNANASGPSSQDAAATRRQAVRPPWFALSRWPLAGIAASVLALFAVGFYLLAVRPAPVSADEIARKAQEAAASPEAGGIKSFAATERTVSRAGSPRMNEYAGLTGDEEIRSETKRWFEAPNRWRVEASGITVDSQDKEIPDHAWNWIGVSDGKDYWRYDPKANSVTVHEIGVDPSGKPNSYGGESPLGWGTMDLQAFLQLSNPNVRPTLRGEETVAGRPAYILDFKTGTQSASAPEIGGPRTVWVDKENYFVLKVVQYSGIDGKLLSTMEVMSIQFGAAIDPGLFTFAPPQGAKVDDRRPRPAPTKGQFEQQMEALARKADFPIFLPTQLPNGLMPRQPRMEPESGLQLEYAPPAEAGTDSFARLRITEQLATYDLVSRWTEGAVSTTINGAPAWLREGFRDVDGTGTDSAALVLKDGTLVSVSSFTIMAEDLATIAASLEPVPGAHTPLPNPTAPSIDEVRQKATFKLFLPGYVPQTVRPEPPVPGKTRGGDRFDTMSILFHNSDGAVALRLMESSQQDQSLARPMQTAPEVAIQDGITGRLIDAPAGQTRLLLWEQDGTFISLETRVLSKEELLRIAASMSTAVTPWQLEPRVSRPTPTPVAEPKFAVLRPTWLPEQMVERRQYQPDPTGKGSQVMIGFDPRPEDQKPHGVLTLTEMAKGAAPSGGKPDPEETHETIGGRDVRVISRGENWITLMWVQGDVALTLTNPYDPPGHPRYTPDQLRKVVESIR